MTLCTSLRMLNSRKPSSRLTTALARLQHTSSGSLSRSRRLTAAHARLRHAGNRAARLGGRRITPRARLRRASGPAVSGCPLVTAAPELVRMTMAVRRGSPTLRAGSRTATLRSCRLPTRATAAGRTAEAGCRSTATRSRLRKRLHGDIGDRCRSAYDAWRSPGHSLRSPCAEASRGASLYSR